MLCILEIVCLVYGIITLVRGRFPMNLNKEVRGGPAYLIGGLLIAVIPVAIVSAVILNWDELQQGNGPQPFQFDFAMIVPDLIGLGGCGGPALLIAFATARPVRKKKKRRRDEDYDDYEQDDDDRPRRRYEDDDDDYDRPRRRRHDDD